MKRAFFASVIFHLSLGLLLGLWICPWFEKLTPDLRAVIDLDVLTIGPRSQDVALERRASRTRGVRSPGANLARSQSQAVPKKEANRTPEVPASAASERPALAGDGEKSERDQDSSPMSAVRKPSLLRMSDEQGLTRTMTVQDYVAWVRAHNEAPLYPRLARIRGDQGRVLIRVEVSRDGHPIGSAQLEQSSGTPLLDDVALESARSWRFPPFQADVESIVVLIPFKFFLD